VLRERGFRARNAARAFSVLRPSNYYSQATYDLFCEKSEFFQEKKVPISAFLALIELAHPLISLPTTWVN
jgi:hypothetical protein